MTISLMVLTGVVLAVLSSARDAGGLSLGERIGVIPIEGIIADDREVLKHIRRFRDDRSIKGYVIAINSPGGSVGPSQSIYSELKKLRSEERRVGKECRDRRRRDEEREIMWRTGMV